MPGAELVSRGREAFARRAWADAFDSLSRADQAAPLGAEELELLATSAYMLGRDDEHLRALERAHHAHLDSGDTPRAVHCAYWIGHNLMLRGEMGPATGWFGRGQRLLEREERDCAERRLPADPGPGASRDRRRPCSRVRHRDEDRRDRDALRRSGSHRHRGARAGSRPRQAGALRGGPTTARRGDGGRHRGGAVADRHRARLLQHDRVLAERVRATPRPRVDRGPDPLVRAAARHGRPHRRLPRASSRDHAVAGRLGRSTRGGAARRRAFRGRGAQRTGLREGLLPAGRGPPAPGRAERGRRVVPGGKSARVRAPAGPGAAAPGGREGRRRVLSDPAGARRGLAAARACGAASRLRRDHARWWRDRGRRAAPVASSRPSRELTGATCYGRCPPRREERWRWPKAIPRRLSWRSGKHGRHGRSSKRPTRPHACASSWRSGAGQRATRTPPRGSWTPPAACSTGSGRGSGRRAGRLARRRVRRRPLLMDSRSASCRFYASSPRARRTGRSPPSSCSASGRSTGT